MRRKYKYIVGIIILGLILIGGGITYGYLRVNRVQEEANAISLLSCLSVLIVDDGPLNLKDAYPVEDAYAISTVKPYEFAVKNNCGVNMDIGINMDTLQVENMLDKKHVKVWIKSLETNEEIYKGLTGNNSFEQASVTAENGVSSNYLMSTMIEAGKAQRFKLKMWVDYATTTEEGMNKYYESKIVITSSPRPTEEHVYGVRRNVDASSSAWERTDEAVGLVANAQIGDTPVQNDFDDIYPWSAIETYSLNLETKEEIYLSETGIEEFPFDGSHGEILTRIPEFYYQRYQQEESDGNTYEYIKISSTFKEGYERSEAFSVGRYTMSGNSTAVHSKSGVKTLASTTITNFRTYAKKLGSDFGQLDYRYFIIQLLYLVEYADYNSQAKLGQGNVNNTAAITSGECNTLGMKSGTLIDDGKHSMIYRGIEDIYGNVWQAVDGINFSSYVTYVCYDPSQYAVDTFTGCYQSVGYTNLNENEKYISKLGYDRNNPLIAMPIASGGSASTYITDYYYSASGNRIARVGGRYDSGTDAGLWFWVVLNASSYSGADVGARLLRTS